MTDYATRIPDGAAYALEKLESAGYGAHLVGGCVRDLVRGAEPRNWDICTSALPGQVRAVFADHGVIDTGLAHGTVTLLVDGDAYEITTYRIDGEYADGRHPDEVKFTTDLEANLARRDFTMNAIAMDVRGNLHDPFGGAGDIRDGVVRCAGDPDARFREDGLRPMRAVRFAATLGYGIHPDTAAAVHRNAEMLDKVAPERIRAELVKLVAGPKAADVLREYPDLVRRFWPEIGPMVGLGQKNPWHRYDVWEHTLHALEAAPPDPVVRLAVLLHDVGKPPCMTVDAAGAGHFPGHPEEGAAMADGMLRRLRFDNETRSRVTRLVELHDVEVQVKRSSVLKALAKIGPDLFFDYVQVRRADVSAQAKNVDVRLAALAKVEATARRLVDGGACLSVGDLAIDGRDVVAAGIPEGPDVGLVLRAVLDRVLSGKLPNKKYDLKREVRYLKDHPWKYRKGKTHRD